MPEDPSSKNAVSAVPGLAIVGCLTVGVIGLVLALVGLRQPEIQPGLCLVASAIGFGSVVHSSFRK